METDRIRAEEPFETKSEGGKQEKIMIKAKTQVKAIAYSMHEAVAARPESLISACDTDGYRLTNLRASAERAAW